MTTALNSPNNSLSSTSTASTKICRICHVVENPGNSKKAKISHPLDYGKEVNGGFMSILSRFFIHKTHTKTAEYTEDDELIAPCKCRGTMRFVHRDCLNQWRTASPRSDSFIRCEQCFASYAFKNTWITSLLVHPFTIYSVCTVLFLAWIAASTFVATGALYRNDPTSIVSQADLLNLLPTIYFDSKGHNPLSGLLHSCPSITDFVFAYNDFMEKCNGLFYGLIFVSLTEYIFFTPSFILSFNTLFCLWRIQRYEIFFDKWLLIGFTAFGMWRAAKSLHAMIESATSRVVKLKLLEVINREEQQEDLKTD